MNIKRIKLLITLITLITLSTMELFAEATATLYLMRPSDIHSALVGKGVFVDVAGVGIGNLPNKRYIKLEIPANVEIEVGAYARGLITIVRRSISIILEEGETCYMHLTFTSEIAGYGTRTSYNTSYIPGAGYGTPTTSYITKEKNTYAEKAYDIQWYKGSMLEKMKEKEAENLELLAKQLELKEEQSTINKQYEEISKATAKDMPTPTVESDVDQNIPQSNKQSGNTYVLIIANEDYQFVDDVNFAAHDGEIFKEYCIKTLGIPERQIRYCANASYGVISDGVDWLKYALNNFEGSKAIVYYCGHGIPDEKTGDAYIIPVDGKGTNTTTCYSLNTLYTTLANTKASNITYFMDACFTGANKEGSMLVAARGVAREAKKETLQGNSVVFSASSGDETAMTYPEKGHGLFTYFLLKKLQETQGNVSYSELADYINKNVKKEAFLINEKPQNPVVATSTAASSTWKNMTLK